MSLFTYRCPKTGQLVQAFSAQNVSEDMHTYEFVRCVLCQRIHRVNPATGVILGGNISKSRRAVDRGQTE
jgi:hypothetical protein